MGTAKGPCGVFKWEKPHRFKYFSTWSPISSCLGGYVSLRRRALLRKYITVGRPLSLSLSLNLPANESVTGQPLAHVTMPLSLPWWIPAPWSWDLQWTFLLSKLLLPGWSIPATAELQRQVAYLNWQKMSAYSGRIPLAWSTVTRKVKALPSFRWLPISSENPSITIFPSSKVPDFKSAELMIHTRVR